MKPETTTETFTFRLVSPLGVVEESDVSLAVLPGSEGEVGILKKHIPFISDLNPGMIQLFKGETLHQQYFVAEGFIDMTGEACTVLAEEAVHVNDLDKSETEEALSRLNAQIEAAEDELQKATLCNDRQMVQAKLDLLKRLKR